MKELTREELTQVAGGHGPDHHDAHHLKGYSNHHVSGGSYHKQSFYFHYNMWNKKDCYGYSYGYGYDYAYGYGY